MGTYINASLNTSCTKITNVLCTMMDVLSQAVALGDGWVAIATGLNMLRLFSVGGIQQNILCLPGPVVAMAAHKQKLCIAYSSTLCEYIPMGLLLI